MAKDEHATSVVVVFDPRGRRPLAAIFLNSQMSNDYYEYIHYRWNYRDYYRYSIDAETAQNLQQTGLKTLTLGTNGSTSENTDGILQHESGGLDLVINSQIPLIDASHDLQIAGDDMNCALYSVNFLNAIGRLLTTEENRIFELALTIDHGLADQRSQATDQLVYLFREGIKKFLSGYYESDGRTKSLDEIRRHHLHQRWDIGSLVIEDLARPQSRNEAGQSLKKVQ